MLIAVLLLGGRVMKGYKLIILLAIILVVITLTIFVFYMYNKNLYKDHTIEDFFKYKNLSLDKLLIRNGNTGEQVETSEQRNIDDCIAILKEMTFKRRINQHAMTGTTYIIEFYDMNNSIAFSAYGFGGNALVIDGVYYDTNENVTQKITELFERIRK
jgi:hypothetical protein